MIHNAEFNTAWGGLFSFMGFPQCNTSSGSPCWRLITYSIAFVCYRPSITHENSPLFCILCLHCLLCVCTRTSSFFVSLQMTLLIHVNSLTAFNASHFLNSETWHMISIIGHQRRLTSVILRRLTPECCYPLRNEWPDEHLFHLQ